MDIIEFIEKVYGIELWDYQKETIKAVADLPEGSTIVMGRNGPVILDKDGKRIRPKRKETPILRYPFACRQSRTGHEKSQIQKMKDIWNAFPDEDKPEWLSMEEIEELFESNEK